MSDQATDSLDRRTRLTRICSARHPDIGPAQPALFGMFTIGVGAAAIDGALVALVGFLGGLVLAWRWSR